MDRISREDFFELPLDDIAARSGLELPEAESELEAYREKAWESYKLDIANRDEWGGTEGESVPNPE